MALRLQSTFYNVNNLRWDVCIYDKDYVGSVIDFNIDNSQGVTIDYQGEGEGLHVPILTSKMEVGMWIDSADIQTFIDDLASSYEGQFRMQLKEDSVIERWTGVILADLISYQDLPQEVRPSFKLRATDGIKRLQKIAYKDTSGPYTGKESVVQHLTKCISFLDTTDLITYLSYTLIIANQWEPANIAAGDVLNNTDFQHRALYQVDNRGNYKYTSVYKVIEQICKRFDCQFKMINGSYWFSQHNYHSETSWTIYRYNSSGTLTTSSSVNNENTQSALWTEKKKGGVYTFFPALKSAVVNYVHFGYINIAKGYTWDQGTQPTIPVSPTTYAVQANTSFFFAGNLRFTLTYSGSRPYYLKFNFTLQVGSAQWLNRPATAANPVYYGEQTIEATTDNYEVVFPIELADGYSYGEGRERLTWTSIEFPTEGDVLFSIDLDGAYDQQGNSVAGVSSFWTFSDCELSPLASGDATNWTNTKRYTAVNAVVGNTEKEVINLAIGQELGYGKLIIDNGVDEEDGVSWGVGASASGVSIEQLLGEEIIKTQSVPIRKLSAEIDVPLADLGKTMVHGSSRWVFYKGKWIADYERVRGEWIQLDTSGTSSGNLDEDVILDELDPNGGDITPADPLGGGVPNPDGDNSGGDDGTGVPSVIDALFPRTTADLTVIGGAITQIPIAARGVDGEYSVGQTITVIDPVTGAQQDWVITQESQNGDTVLYVASDTPDFDFRTGSWIVTSQEQQLSGGGSTAFYREEFPTHASATITVTANSGNLPSNAAAIRVYFDNGQLISKNYWSHSGSDITLTYTPNGAQSIWVEFNV